MDSLQTQSGKPRTDKSSFTIGQSSLTQTKISAFSQNQSKFKLNGSQHTGLSCLPTHQDIVQGFISKSESLRRKKRGQILKRKRMVRLVETRADGQQVRPMGALGKTGGGPLSGLSAEQQGRLDELVAQVQTLILQLEQSVEEQVGQIQSSSQNNTQKLTKE